MSPVIAVLVGQGVGAAWVLNQRGLGEGLSRTCRGFCSWLPGGPGGGGVGGQPLAPNSSAALMRVSAQQLDE